MSTNNNNKFYWPNTVKKCCSNGSLKDKQTCRDRPGTSVENRCKPKKKNVKSNVADVDQYTTYGTNKQQETVMLKEKKEEKEGKKEKEKAEE